MAKGEYAIQISAKVKDVDDVKKLEKSLADLGVRVKKVDAGVKGLSVEFLAFGATLLATAGSAVLMGSKLQDTLFTSERALDRVGLAADQVAASFNRAGTAATEMLPLAARFANFGIAADQIEGVTTVAHEMGLILGMSTKKAGGALADLAGSLGVTTEPEVRKLASGLEELELAFAGSFDKNVELMRVLGLQAAQWEINQSSITGVRTAMESFGVGAGEAQQSIHRMIKSFEFGTEHIASFATVLGAPAETLAKIRDEATSNDERFRLMAKSIGMTALSTEELQYRLMEYLGVGENVAFQMARMAGEGDRLNDFLGIAAKGFGDGGNHAKNFEDAGRLLSVQLKLLWKQVRSMAQEVGERLAPIMAGLVQVIRVVLGVFNMLPSGVHAAIVAVVGLTGGVMLLGKVMMSTYVVGALQSVKVMTNFTLALLSTDAATRATAISTLKLRTAKIRESAATVYQIAKNLVLIGGLVIENTLLGIGRVATLALAGAKGVLSVAVSKAGAALLTFAGKAVVAAISAIGSLFAWAMTFVATAVPAMVSGLGAIAAAAWAAVAPLLPFIAIGALVVAAVAAVGYAIYKLVGFLAQNWGAIWGAATAAVEAFWSGLQAVWGAVTAVASAIWGGIIASVKVLWRLLVTVGGAIAAPFLALWDAIKGIGEAIGGVVGLLFGSSMFHIKEGVTEVIPSLRRMEGTFTGVGRAARRVGLESHIPDDIRVRVAEPMGRIGVGRDAGVSDEFQGKQALGGPAGSGSGGREESYGVSFRPTGESGEPMRARVVVPVTVTLDGDVLARAMTEHEVNLSPERHMRASREPMRGTGR